MMLERDMPMMPRDADDAADDDADAFATMRLRAFSSSPIQLMLDYAPPLFLPCRYLYAPARRFRRVMLYADICRQRCHAFTLFLAGACRFDVLFLTLLRLFRYALRFILPLDCRQLPRCRARYARRYAGARVHVMLLRHARCYATLRLLLIRDRCCARGESASAAFYAH